MRKPLNVLVPGADSGGSTPAHVSAVDRRPLNGPTALRNRSNVVNHRIHLGNLLGLQVRVLTMLACSERLKFGTTSGRAS